MPASIGVNLRVTGHCRQGGRKYMEDFFSVAYQQTEDEKDLEYAFFGIYDGHGGAEAAAFAKEHLMESIVKHRGFWSNDDEEVLRSIKDGFIHTHLAMWKIHDKWPKTQSGLPSTAGTTASIAFIRHGKIYIGHVGDSGITLGYQEPDCVDWRARALTKDHKPESEAEMLRIEQSGGKVVSKSGVPRVVWNRPRIGHKGPVRRSTPIDEIPFLAVARSLGDLWSYNSALDEFVVSPTPDVAVIPIDTNTFRCLIFGTDGLYNMLSSHMAVHIVQQAEKHNEQAALSDYPNKIWINPSKCLVEKALERWSNTKMRADNTSVITLMLDPPGPPRAQVLRNKKNPYTSSGLQIERRYEEKDDNKPSTDQETPTGSFDKVSDESAKPDDIEHTDLSKIDDTLDAEVDKHFIPKPRESTTFNTRPPDYQAAISKSHQEEYKNDIQINEVSSSMDNDNENRLKEASPKNDKRNLRSSGLKKPVVVSNSRAGKKDRNSGERSPLGENMAESSSKNGQENRVLRERKNTPNDKNPLQKKKCIMKKKMALSAEKKKLLHNVLFRGSNKETNTKPNGRKNWTQKEARASTPSRSEEKPSKTKENSRILRNSDRIPPSKPPPLQPISKRKTESILVPDPAKSKKDMKTKIKQEKREVRKSTLAQKLRMHQEVFKAKLRRRSSAAKKLTKDKVMRFKRPPMKRS